MARWRSASTLLTTAPVRMRPALQSKTWVMFVPWAQQHAHPLSLNSALFTPRRKT
ncbi:hypothetical protein [Alcanivorax sp.]|uniref:hypothetical protein n=1 Tax=Alcanivorax sp. TaxID=1872427 RepID=UPI0032D9820C